VADVEHTAGVADRGGPAALCVVLAGPIHLPGLGLGAPDPAAVIVVAVQVVADPDDPAVLVFQLLRPVQLLDLVLPARRGDAKHTGPAAVTGRGEDHVRVVEEDDRRDVGRVVGESLVGRAVAPKEAPGVGVEADDALGRQGDVLPGAAGPTDHDRRIAGRLAVGSVAFPDRFARLLVQGEHGGFAAAWGADDLVPVHERGFGETPAAA